MEDTEPPESNMKANVEKNQTPSSFFKAMWG